MRINGNLLLLQSLDTASQKYAFKRVMMQLKQDLRNKAKQTELLWTEIFSFSLLLNCLWVKDHYNEEQTRNKRSPVTLIYQTRHFPMLESLLYFTHYRNSPWMISIREGQDMIPVMSLGSVKLTGHRTKIQLIFFLLALTFCILCTV